MFGRGWRPFRSGRFLIELLVLFVELGLFNC
jgi:hypothetical protein